MALKPFHEETIATFIIMWRSYFFPWQSVINKLRELTKRARHNLTD